MLRLRKSKLYLKKYFPKTLKLFQKKNVYIKNNNRFRNIYNNDLSTILAYNNVRKAKIYTNSTKKLVRIIYKNHISITCLL